MCVTGLYMSFYGNQVIIPERILAATFIVIIALISLNVFMFRLKKEMVLRLNQVAAEFRKVSNKQMAETTKRTIRENVSINAQLAKMSDKTMELIQENDELKSKEKKMKLHIDMLEHNEKELAKKNSSNQKVMYIS